MGAPHSQPKTDIERAERDAQILELKRQDLTFAEIAEELGISKTAAFNAFHRALPRIPEPAAAAYRTEHLARLELARQAVLEVLTNRHLTVSNGQVIRVDGKTLEDDGPVLAAVDRLLRIDEREAKLLGLDAPTKSRVEVVTDDIAQALVAQLEAELARLAEAESDTDPD